MRLGRRSGVPLKVVFRGIDQYCERYYAKGPRRRPVRIEFCEADVLDLFDAWRRAVGVSSSGSTAAGPVEEAAPRKGPLATHIERAIARLATVRARAHQSAGFNDVIDEAVRELEAMNGGARQARGDARARIIEALTRIDARVMDAAREAFDESAAIRCGAKQMPSLPLLARGSIPMSVPVRWQLRSTALFVRPSAFR